MQDTMESTMLVVVWEDDIYGGDEKKERLISMYPSWNGLLLVKYLH